jgi:ABC-type Mn2+/Zn2+ transport system ATPase subunit
LTHSAEAGAPARVTPSQSSEAAIRLTGVSAGYDGRPALENVSLEIQRGSLTAVVGPNGGGKSTLLKVIANLLPAWSGTVEVLGAPPGVRAHDVAYVPQAESVDWAFPVAARDVVMMGRYPRLGPLRRPGATDRAAVDQALRAVGMGEFADRQIGALSGGQRRRVFLARALAAEPLLYLLDEPVTGVDATTEHDLAAVLEAEAKAGKTIVASTHDLAAAAHHFGQIVAVNRTIIAQGDASLISNEDVLTRTYGGHLVFVGERMAVLDDPHHHDQEAHGEVHHHDSDRHPHSPSGNRPGGNVHRE